MSSEWIQPRDTPEFVRGVMSEHFSERGFVFLDGAFALTEALFAGRYPGYQASDSAYHDLAHTLEATVATVRLLDGHIKSGRAPKLGARDLELAAAGILLHDSGFIKAVGDREGTGAKYTVTHVTRSAEFAAKFLPPLGASADEVRIVQLAIHCTGVKVDVSKLKFHDERERFIGCALGTGDILGQMAAPDYPKRLPALYREYAEAGLTTYASAEDLMRKTRSFYNEYVNVMLDGQWAGVHKALESHFADGKNHYFEAIEANLRRIEELICP